jgi:hydroxyacylglutathione hydrolase
MLKVFSIPALKDNYIYVILDSSTKICACVDPADFESVLSFLKKEDLELSYILNTHHHFDHVGGNLELKKKYRCKIIGNENDKHRIPGIDICLSPGQLFLIGNLEFKVLDLPGHTIGHIGFYFEKNNTLFCGDTLFSFGCGRLFEGTAKQMKDSLLKIRELPDSTKIFFGHEYTESNANFAKSLESDNYHLNLKITEIKSKRKQNQPTVPSKLEDEKKFNPFLRFDDKNYLKKIGIKHESAEKNLMTLRTMKDNF